MPLNIYICLNDSDSYHRNGGKDRVEYFIERSKGNVIEARDSLATIIRILRLQVD